MTEKTDQREPTRQPLPVLPHSDKVEQMKRESAANPAPPPPEPMQANTQQTEQQKQIEQKVIDAVKTVYDPEIPVNIYELGLIYDIDVADDNSVKVKMTLTAPGCPVAGSLPIEVENRISMIPEVPRAEVELVWDPPWTKDRMSEAARLVLGFM